MARSLRIQFPGAYYHITCRGVERRMIYADDSDRKRFLALLSNSLTTYHVSLHAFVLMANHFHLLIQTKKANCSEFMRHFNICYTSWFNWRHNRCGNLYQGRYKAFLIDADDYLLTVSRYLHLNPARKKIKEIGDYWEKWQMVKDFRWSSLPGYLNLKYKDTFVHYDQVLSIAGGRGQYTQYIIDGLKKDIGSPFLQIASGSILGDRNFINKAIKNIPQASEREQPEYKKLINYHTVEPTYLLKFITKTGDIDDQQLTTRNRFGLIRGMVAEILYRYCEITQQQIGKYLGNLDYISVQMLRRRLKVRLNEDPKLKKQFENLISMIDEKMYNEKI